MPSRTLPHHRSGSMSGDVRRVGPPSGGTAAVLSPKTPVGLVARQSRSEARRSLGGPRTRDVVGNYVAGAAGPKGKSQPRDGRRSRGLLWFSGYNAAPAVPGRLITLRSDCSVLGCKPA
jgi:hypothetical protein